MNTNYKEGDIVILTKKYEGIAKDQIGTIIKLMDNGVIFQTSIMNGENQSSFRGYRVFVLYSDIKKK